MYNVSKTFVLNNLFNFLNNIPLSDLMCLIQLLDLTKIIYNLNLNYYGLYNIYIFRIVIKIQLNIKN